MVANIRILGDYPQGTKVVSRKGSLMIDPPIPPKKRQPHRLAGLSQSL